jgi:tetratricopeptide (TPR) repeat protein
VWALALVSASAGCLTPQTTPLPPGPKPAPQEVVKLADPPKRMPQAKTCVAFGQFREREAKQSNVTPGQREQMVEEARKAYQQALEIDPNNLQAFFALAHLYEARGDAARCLETYRDALKRLPREASLWFAQGMCHMRFKQWEPAVQELQRAAALKPDNRQYAKTYGFCLGHLGRFDESLAVLMKLEDKSAAYCEVARIARHLHRDDLCKSYLRMALQAKPDSVDARKMLDQLEAQPVVPVKAQVEYSVDQPTSALVR